MPRGWKPRTWSPGERAFRPAEWSPRKIQGFSPGLRLPASRRPRLGNRHPQTVILRGAARLFPTRGFQRAALRSRGISPRLTPCRPYMAPNRNHRNAAHHLRRPHQGNSPTPRLPQSKLPQISFVAASLPAAGTLASPVREWKPRTLSPGKRPFGSRNGLVLNPGFSPRALCRRVSCLPQARSPDLGNPVTTRHSERSLRSEEPLRARFLRRPALSL